MSETTVSRVLAVLRKHSQEMCTNSYTMVEGEVERHCVLAWMAMEANIELPGPDYDTEVIGMPGTYRFADELQREYSLSLNALKRLQRANDDARDVYELMDMVPSLLESAVKVEMEYVAPASMALAQAVG